MITDGENGYLVAANDLELFVERVYRLLVDTNLRDCFRSAGIKSIEDRFSLDQYVNNHEQLYESIRR